MKFYSLLLLSSFLCNQAFVFGIYNANISFMPFTDLLGHVDEPKKKPTSPKSNPSPENKKQFHVMHAGLRHTEARGVGYQEGYTTLEGFGIYNANTSFMPFIDLRGHVFDNGKFGGNVGVGGRSLLCSIGHVLGYYLYYDVRQDRHHLTPQQLSPGIELLGNRMEYRMNGYFPIGNQKSHKYHFDFDSFKGHHVILKAKQRDVMIGGDAEVGAHLTQSTKYDLYAGVGPYYFSSPHASSWGGKTRLLGRYKEYIALEASYSYDHLFRSVVQGTIAFNFPFGKRLQSRGKECSSQTNLALSRAAFAPYRFEIPVVKKVTRREKAINPATGNPWQVWFVDNTSSSAGSIESPFPTLVQAQNASSPWDAIYVFPGNGTTQGMDAGIVLQDGQKLFGSGISQVFPTTQGSITVPAQSKTFPNITNAILNTSGVNLGNDCEVSGLYISNTNGGNGINGGDPSVLPTFLGITNTYIHDNIFTNCTVTNGAISLHNCQGNLMIENNTIDTVTIGSLGGLISGINIFNFHLPVTSSVVITNNIVQNTAANGHGGAGIAVDSQGLGDNINASIQNNLITNCVNGIHIFASNTGTNICATISGNQINQALSAGVNMVSTLSSLVSANVENNTITNAAVSGVLAISNSSSTLHVQLTDNSSSSGYSLIQTGSSEFILSALVGNVGAPFNIAGTITLTETDVSCPGQ